MFLQPSSVGLASWQLLKLTQAYIFLFFLTARLILCCGEHDTSSFERASGSSVGRRRGRDSLSCEHTAPPRLQVFLDAADVSWLRCFGQGSTGECLSALIGVTPVVVSVSLGVDYSSITHPAINVSALLFTRTKCCHCYVKYLLRAFCRCAVRSHSAVPLNLRAYPRWPICAQKETQILYLMPPPRKCANLPRANSTCSCGCLPTVL